MSNLGRHRADHCETLRLELSMLQPLAFFHLRPQRGSSVLHCLLQMIVRTAKRRQQPDNDEKEHKKHDGVPDGNQRMLIRRPTEYVAEEPHARAQRSHCQSGRAPGHPSREARRQQVKSRYCPLTTRKIIHKAKNNCQRHSRGSRGHLRSRTKLSPWIHLELTAGNFDKTVRNFVHGSVYFRRDQNHYPAATSTCQTKTGVTFVRAKLEKSLAPVNSHSPLSAGLFGHHLFFAMPHRNTIPSPQGVAKVVTRAELQNFDAWELAFRNKCKDHRYYEIVDETLEGNFEHHYLVLEDGSGNIGGVQPVFFLRQNLIEGVRGKIRSVVDSIRKTFPRFLTMRVLMVGCAAGTGDLGGSNPKDEQFVAEALSATLRTYARESRASLVVLKDFPARYRRTLAVLSDDGYARVPSMPMTRLALSFQNFDEYLQTLGYVSRKSLRRKFRKTEQDAKIDMEVVNDITPNIDAIYPIYLQVHERSPM